MKEEEKLYENAQRSVGASDLERVMGRVRSHIKPELVATGGGGRGRDSIPKHLTLSKLSFILFGGQCLIVAWTKSVTDLRLHSFLGFFLFVYDIR